MKKLTSVFLIAVIMTISICSSSIGFIAPMKMEKKCDEIIKVYNYFSKNVRGSNLTIANLTIAYYTDRRR